MPGDAEAVQVQLGRLRLDTVGKRAWLDDKALDLNAREWAALAFLTSRVNRIVSKEQLMQALYDWQDDISANAIEKLLSRLRSKLEAAGLTVYGGTGQTYNEVFEKIATLGKITNREANATRLITKMRGDLNALQQSAKRQ